MYSPAYKLVTPALMQACHQQRRQVVPWTVNTPAEATQLLETGVDGLITDYPDLLTGK